MGPENSVSQSLAIDLCAFHAGGGAHHWQMPAWKGTVVTFRDHLTRQLVRLLFPICTLVKGDEAVRLDQAPHLAAKLPSCIIGNTNLILLFPANVRRFTGPSYPAS